MFKRATHSDDHEGLSPKQISDLVKSTREQADYLLSCVRILLYLIKDFSFALGEAKAEDFKKRIDEVLNALDAADSPKAAQRAFDSGKDTIIKFIALEKQYLADKETELKEIIEFLRSTLTSVVGENQDFNNQLYEQNIRMEKIVQLDDIRKIKESLMSEVATMRVSIQAKQVSDAKRIETLCREVEVLRDSLQDYKGVAATDPLTKAANRLAFDTHIRACVEQYEIRRRPLSVLMCDIDDFRGFNTAHGHQMGDLVLQVFVAKCKSMLREGDMIARYGGDEFTIILPGASLKQALAVARRLCAAVSSAAYIHETQMEKVEFSFSASIGVAETHRYDKVNTLIERADRAMYAAKHAGKGCVRSEKDLSKADLHASSARKAA
jgi:diguanylate cyclase